MKRALCSIGLVGCLIALAPDTPAAPPSTFGTTAGTTLLCLNPLDEVYFRNYFQEAFGKPFKREGGAYWFKTDATLWGVPVLNVMVSDESSNYTFLAAVLDTTPDKLEQAIFDFAGIRHAKTGPGKYPILQSKPGSQIIHFQQKAKIFCSKIRYLLPN
ncbi:MAG: hypothetical protein RL748_591 [Pseudomonadota bacterium]|jgi:hypothetical protein